MCIRDRLPTIDALKGAYFSLQYGDKFSEEGKKKFFDKFLDPKSVHGRNDGAHVAYIEAQLERTKANPWGAATPFPTALDAHIADTVDCLVRLWGADSLRASFPRLMRLYDEFRAIPSVKEYIATRQPKQ